ncbi:MAG TPA: hypothetical protein VHB25_12850 [Gemmatimonadaceae bacterium]|nr:hypothetical protein [Gemmatimonadaceae bacterium]
MSDHAHDGSTSQVHDHIRVIRDPEYRDWQVREIASPTYDRRRGRSLVFISDDVMRRVWSYPANWYELSDETLYLLSLGR